MHDMKNWKIGVPDMTSVMELKNGSDLSILSCMVLVSQGCTDLTQAEAFLGCRELSAPALICDMLKAAEIINQAVDGGKRICVYGDYDCDGVMSTVILYSYLSEMGANVTWRIPERCEGYGLNEQAVNEMHEDGVQLIVTVDNGIAAVKEAELIKSLGMDLVITDHHQPGETLPEALAIVDAHRNDNFSPFRLYCGAGIALLLVAAMNDGDIQMAMEQFGDLAAIATIADVVPLKGENRFLVQRGMEYLENTERPGLLALRKVSSLDGRPLTAVSIAFGITPRINAAGRLESPKLAVELMLEEDPQRAEELAAEINSINSRRKETESEIVKSVEAQIEEDPSLLQERVLIFAGEGWHSGVIGIVASRIEERYGKPCFMISVSDGYGHGSARSFGEFHVFRALTHCSSLLEKFGGHPAAGGFTLKEENIPEFREKMAEYARIYHPDMPFFDIQAACVLNPSLLTPESVRSLEQLAPFGAENPEPVFLAEDVVVKEISAVSNGVHTRVKILLNGIEYTAMYFRKSPEETGLCIGKHYHMLVRLNVNEFNGTTSVSLYIQEVRPVGIQQARILNAVWTYEKYCRGEELPEKWYSAMLPERQELVRIYQSLYDGITAEELAAPMAAFNINYCKILIALDIFSEMHLITVSHVTGEIKKIPVQGKINIEESQILANLRKRIS